MYADIGLLFPYYQNFFPEVQPFEDFCKTHKSNALMSNVIPTSMVSDYDLGGEGDLFKAPEPIMEEPMMGLDPMTAAISMISRGEDVISCQTFKDADIESLQKEQLLCEVFYECEKDLLEKAAMESPLSEVLNIKIPIFTTDENLLEENKPLADAPFQKSVSSGCLSSMERVHEAATKSFLNFPGMDLGAAFGMRRAFSEGDIKTLGNGSISFMHSPHERPLIISNCTSEERREKLSRYRNKKTKRNFGRKIKYACRKVLADSQPRIRGRFAKTEESDNKRH